MLYLFHLNAKHGKLFKQKKLVILVVSIFIFSVIHYFLGIKHYNVKSTHKMNYFDALYLSVVTQSLLGPGDISPKTDLARLFLMSQVLITIIVTFMYINK